MTDRKKDLFDAYAAGRLSRRDLMRGAAQLGLTAAGANFLLGSSATDAMAADYDWQAQKGTAIKLVLNKHPYADAMIADIENFKKLTGIAISYDVFPEDVYFDKVTAALSSKSDQYDAFMTGAYMTWTYGPAGWIEDLNSYIKDASKTNPAFNWEDVLPGLRASTAWDGVAGSELGSGKAKQWCIPWGYELNNIAYNRKIFDKVGVKPPKNLDEMLEVAAKITKDAGGYYGVGVRGSRSWATIHPGFLSAYANYGQKDFVVKGGKLTPAMNTKESKEFHKMWIDMIQRGGPKNWTTYTWYEVGNDLGAGNSAMIFDADILGYFQNNGTKEAGNIVYLPFTANPAVDKPTPNVWIWSLAMSEFCKMKEAAWFFIQWASGTQNTTFGAVNADLVDPVRDSVWKVPEFQARLEKSYPGYLNQ